MNATSGVALLLWLAAGIAGTGAEFRKVPIAVESSQRTVVREIPPVPNAPTPVQDPGADQGTGQEKEPKPPAQPVTVTGRVRDSDGRAVARAQVTIVGPSRQAAQTSTDDSGSFSFTGPEGAYQIAVKATDKAGGPFPATIANGRLNPAEFTLR